MGLCKELGIPVANNGGANAGDVAEHTIALILCFYRRLIELNRNVHEGRWRGDINAGMSTYTINGKTLGIVGFGKIGNRVSILGRALNGYLIYYDINRVPKTMEQDLGIAFVTLENLLQESDIVTLHVPSHAGDTCSHWCARAIHGQAIPHLVSYQDDRPGNPP